MSCLSHHGNESCLDFNTPYDFDYIHKSEQLLIEPRLIQHRNHPQSLHSQNTSHLLNIGLANPNRHYSGMSKVVK
jgi:hypothetical protein